MRPLGASSFRGSYRASYSLTGTAAGDSALFLLPPTKEGQKEARKLTENLVRIAAAELNCRGDHIQKNKYAYSDISVREIRSS